MKSVILYSVLAAGLMPAEDDWTYFLDQRNLISNDLVRTEVADEGSMISQMAIPEGGSEFILWAKESRGTEAPVIHQVGVDVVGAYLPSGTLSITTPDPYAGGIPRTRVDQGFTLHADVSGLLASGPNTPLAAQKVLLDHRVELFEFKDEVLTSVSAAQIFEQSFIDKNGSLNESYIGNLPGVNVFTESGLETFNLYALPDGQIAQLELAQAQVQVWPLATASNSGYDPGVIYQSLPDVTFEIENLYPKSETYLRFYQGKQSDTAVGTRILDVQILVDQETPRDGTIVLSSPEVYVDQAGAWTIELLTITPFGTELLDFVEINFNPNLKIRGGINSLE